MQQFMGNLPSARVNVVEKPFYNTAVDYTGAFYVKMTNSRGCKSQKAYVAIFVCMATKAIHVELVSDMTAKAFIAAFRRFVSRRGAIKNLFSDNGTNFVLSNKILAENITSIDKNEYHETICTELAKAKTNWFFSPPGAPHFNGLAEAAVKSVKLHLKKTIGDTKLSFEELNTLLNQIEACVNSRPLCAISSDPNDAGVLTPAHFLIGEPTICPPEQNHLEAKVNWLDRWQRVQQMVQLFWKRWQSDYLNQLQMRTKWTDEREAPKIGDSVLIREENLPPAQWQTGKIVDTHPGDDNLIRVVSVKVGDSTFKRPITKICLYPRDENGQSITTNVAKISTRSITNRQKKSNILPIITALLAISTTLSRSMPIEGDQSFKITHFDHAPGLYFEKNYDMFVSDANWNVLAFFDVKDFRREFKTVRANFESARDVCVNILQKKHGCTDMIEHLEIKLERLTEINTLIFGTKRTKRAVLDFVGDIAGDMFGVLGSRFKEEYGQDISKITKNEQHLLKLLANHTSILESNLKILKNDEIQMEKQTENFNNLLKFVSLNTDQMESHQSFSDAAIFLTQIIGEFEQRQNEILRTLLDSGKNVISHALFSPSQIEKQVELMQNQVGNKYTIPNGMDIYSIGKIRVNRANNHFIFQISIPLLSLQKYGVYRIFQVPFRKNDSFLQVQNAHGYLIAASDRQQYRLTESFDERACKPYADTIICDGPKYWLTHEKSTCVWNLFNHLSHDDCSLENCQSKSKIYELRANRFIFSTYDSLNAIVICNEVVNHEQLSGEGILELSPRCYLKNINFQLHANLELNNAPQITIPKLKFENNSDWGVQSINLEENSKFNVTFLAHNFREIENRLNATRDNLHLNSVNAHDVHHYTLIYSCMIGIMVLLFYYRKARPGKLIPMPSIIFPGPQNVDDSQHI